MLRFIARRVLQTIPVLFIIVTATFFMLRYVPGDSLATGIKLPGGEPFEQGKMNADVEWLKELYGSQGYVFADIHAEPIFSEQPGKLDLLYHIEEGKRWRRREL